MKVGSATPVGGTPASGSASPAPSRSPGGRSFIEVLGETGARGGGPPRAEKAPPAAPQRPTRAPTAVAATPLRRMIDGAVAAERRVDLLLEAAARGKTFSASEMLAMQATVFRYSQTVEVISRATDRLVGAVKQTLGTQV